ncbi:V-type proton ATPase subunit S1b [Hoplias malabaricus]|uniref:V-type proton ATPase subunit S1b n=1 Tax=Hoplias malabaricus TaxID=27720 RepID=UPI0034629EAC
MVFTALLCVLLSLCSCRAQVPLVLWSSEGYGLPQQTEPAAGEIVSGGELVSYMKSALTTSPHNVVLFLQDRLSMDDFTVYGGVFGNKQESVFLNLESTLEASAHLVLPSLDWSAALSVEELFQEELGIPAVHIKAAEFPQHQLNSSQPSLLVFRLPYTTGTQLKELLKKNDETIGDVLNSLKARGVPYTAVYTGLKPSHITEDFSVSASGGFSGRSLLQAPSNTTARAPVVFNSTTSGPCILLWANIMNISYDNGPWFNLAPLTFDNIVNLDGSICNETLSRLVLNYGNVLTYKSFQVVFEMSKVYFPVSARNWTLMEHVVLNYDGQSVLFNASRGIYAPAEYSFHCQTVSNTDSPLLVPNSTLDNATHWRILFTDFQIQGFNVTGNFSYASDCASFFTPGIWMGLLTTLLMVFILTYGLHMIMQLRTMDRFDDPKGPAISVPQNE